MTAAPPWGLISVTPQHTATSTSARRRSLAPSDARKQHRRQGEEAQDEAGVEVGPDQEDDRKPRARLRASEGRVQDEDPAEQRIQLRAHVEERSRHRHPKVAAIQLDSRSPERRTRSRKRISHVTTITSHFQYARLSNPNECARQAEEGRAEQVQRRDPPTRVAQPAMHTLRPPRAPAAGARTCGSRPRTRMPSTSRSE
jgi:hypothetical protein